MILRFLREPFWQFILLGAVVYGGLSLLDMQWSGGEKLIKVTPADVARLKESWTAQYKRPPTQDELDKLIGEEIRQEIFYREALKMGLGQDDIIVRRRLAQKFAFLTQDIKSVSDPEGAELEAYFQMNRKRYLVPPYFSFRHIYFSPEQRGLSAGRDAAVLLKSLQGKAAEWRTLGDPFMLRRDYVMQDGEEIENLFGRPFRGALDGLAMDVWQGPIVSAYGVHLVRLIDRKPAYIPLFSDIRETIMMDYRSDARLTANKEFYKELRTRYHIEMPSAIITHSGNKG